MPFRVLIDSETQSVRTTRIGQANLEIIPLAFDDSDVRLVCGQNDPVQGWVSIDTEDRPAPVAIYTRTGRLPMRSGYLMVPFGADRVTSGVRATVDATGGKWIVDVSAPGRTDRIVMDWDSEEGPALE